MRDIIAMLTDKFLEVIDSDITHLEMAKSAMDHLKASVIKRDEEQLKKILAIVENALAAYSNVENQREVIRRELAKCMKCKLDEMTMTKLKDYVSLEQAKEVARKQNILKSLVQDIKENHMVTVMFLQECTRLNDKMLAGILGDRKELTYNSNGHGRWKNVTASSSLVNLRF